ncbi:MAG: hypothetical protein U1F33_05355 [Alphaproteobacteria bacterium]
MSETFRATLLGRVLCAALRGLRWGWTLVDNILDVLKPCRFSAIVVAAGGFALLVTDQGRELSVRLGDSGPKQIQWILFFLIAIAVWAFQSWFWARHILTFVHGRTRDESTRRGWLIRNIPRILGGGAFAFVGCAVLRTWLVTGARNGTLLGLAVATFVLGIAFYLLIMRRREIIARIERHFTKDGQPGQGIVPRLLRRKAELRSFGDLPGTWKIWIWLTGGYSVATALWAWTAPVSMGLTFGAPGVAFLAMSSIVPFGSYLVYLSRAARFPVVTTLLLAAVVFSIWNDNHAVRPAVESSGPILPERKSLAEAVDAWSSCLDAQEGPAPLVMVATAGGGLRAAYWTATVLGAVQDIEPRFADRLFAISGVSGGSLGAAVFASILREDDVHCPQAEGERTPETAGSVERRGQAVLDRDFLAPTLAGLLYPDLMQRFFPLGIFPDRAAALEKSWEHGWRAASWRPAADRFATPFNELWSRSGDGRAAHRPALLLNGTHEETGKRIITSNLKIDPAIFSDTFDFYDVAGYEIRLSTAVLNSARFPYVTPAGRMSRSVIKAEHIVDGGYFENFGAATAQEALRGALKELGRTGHIKVRPVVVQISSDPALAGTDIADDDRVPKAPTPKKGASWGNEAAGPLRAIFATRTARGILASDELAEYTHGLAEGAAPVFVHFRLCAESGAPDPALGWALSKSSEALMARQLRCSCGNGKALSDLLVALGTAREKAEVAARCPTAVAMQP